MKLTLRNVGGTLIPVDHFTKDWMLKQSLTVSLETPEKKMTKPQLNSIWLYCQLVANALNDAGYEVSIYGANQQVVMATPYTKEFIRENLWKPAQKSLTETESTSKLDSKDPNLIYEAVNMFTANNFGISINFPSSLDIR